MKYIVVLLLVATARQVLSQGNYVANSSNSASPGTFNTLVGPGAGAAGPLTGNRNVMLGYSLPKSWISGIGISRVRFYVSGTNLWTKQDYAGYSTEFPGSNPYTSGLDYLNYPMSKTYLFGMDMAF